MDEAQRKHENSAVPGEESGIEKLLRDRAKIDEMLKAKFSQQITVMFTDIKGSTAFFETYGDIEGRLMVQKHNELLFPLIEDNHGRVIKTIGDAIMAAFPEAVGAVRAAIAMQQRLDAYNRKQKEKKDQIHIRIGVNSGEGLVEKNDIFGDVVNVAARIESQSAADEIMIGAAVYEEVRKTDDIVCRHAGSAQVKGKEEPVEIYRVIWGDEQIAGGITRSAPRAARPAGAVVRRLEIDISREADTLRISASEKTEKAESTVRAYAELHVSMARVDEHCRAITGLLNLANISGKVSKDILVGLREAGQALFDDVLTPQAKTALRQARVDEVVFRIEDSLVHIPWELLFDGDQFLCLKFSMGRIVTTRRDIVTGSQRRLSRPLKMLIVADPRGDLENAGREGRAITQQLDRAPSLISANQRSREATPAYLAEKLTNFDMVHYAGHADYDQGDPARSGWLLEGGTFTSADIMRLAGGRPLPSLVFCNACRSGQTEAWSVGPDSNQKVFGLANAFLLAGVQHYVGTFWEILDEPGARCAQEFYRALIEGESIGGALRRARWELVREYGEDTIVWASYMLYGDPSFCYLDIEEAHAAQPGETPPSQPQPQTGLSAPRSFRKKTMLGAAALAALVCISLLFLQYRRMEPGKDAGIAAYELLQTGQVEKARAAFESLAQNDPQRFEGLAALSVHVGEIDTARAMLDKALAIDPDSIYARVINGQIFFTQGNFEEALQAYQNAAERTGAAGWQRAEALNGIARIYSTRGEHARAAEYYRRAAELDSRNAALFANQAYALQRMGDTSGAVAAFQKAAALNPDDPLISTLLAQASRQEQAAADKARQERIDKLVGELADQFKTGAIPQPPVEAWTSRPVTLSFVNFSSRGAPSQREGEDDFFLITLGGLLQESGRIQVVERELLDKLLAELKLSSTELVDPRTALRLGRIVTARVIATGSIMRYKGEVRVTVRLTETETTALKGALAESGSDLTALAGTVAQKISAAIQKAYPLRGEILKLEGNQVVLNIGANTGVYSGMVFRVLEGPAPGQGDASRSLPIGTIIIASVDQDTAYATVQEQSRGLQPFMKVEQAVR